MPICTTELVMIYSRKGIHFEKWFDQTARWLRSHFKRIEGVRFRKVAN